MRFAAQHRHLPRVERNRSPIRNHRSIRRECWSHLRRRIVRQRHRLAPPAEPYAAPRDTTRFLRQPSPAPPRSSRLKKSPFLDFAIFQKLPPLPSSARCSPIPNRASVAADHFASPPPTGTAARDPSPAPCE